MGVKPVVRQALALSISLDIRFARGKAGVEMMTIVTISLALVRVGGMAKEADREFP